MYLGVLDRAEVYVLDKLGGRVAAHIPTAVGGRVWTPVTAMGKSLLAWLAPEDVDAIVAEVPARVLRRRDLAHHDLHAELNRVRMRRGLARDRGEAFADLGSVAAAIRGPRGRWPRSGSSPRSTPRSTGSSRSSSMPRSRSRASSSPACGARAPARSSPSTDLRLPQRLLDLADRIDALPDGPEVDNLIEEAEALQSSITTTMRFVLEQRSRERVAATRAAAFEALGIAEGADLSEAQASAVGLRMVLDQIVSPESVTLASWRRSTPRRTLRTCWP